jgi:hypothetical protein
LSGHGRAGKNEVGEKKTVVFSGSIFLLIFI